MASLGSLTRWIRRRRRRPERVPAPGAPVVAWGLGDFVWIYFAGIVAAVVLRASVGFAITGDTAGHPGALTTALALFGQFGGWFAVLVCVEPRARAAARCGPTSASPLRLRDWWVVARRRRRSRSASALLILPLVNLVERSTRTSSTTSQDSPGPKLAVLRARRGVWSRRSARSCCSGACCCGRCAGGCRRPAAVGLQALVFALAHPLLDPTSAPRRRARRCSPSAPSRASWRCGTGDLSRVDLCCTSASTCSPRCCRSYRRDPATCAAARPESREWQSHAPRFSRTRSVPTMRPRATGVRQGGTECMFAQDVRKARRSRSACGSRAARSSSTAVPVRVEQLAGRRRRAVAGRGPGARPRAALSRRARRVHAGVRRGEPVTRRRAWHAVDSVRHPDRPGRCHRR